MSRSILADAIALIRGDRFLTIEYTRTPLSSLCITTTLILTYCSAFNLTSWGFQDLETTDDNGSLGGMLTKLLFRALPRHYTPRSIYAHFPFIVPSRMRENMKQDPNMIRRYDWSDPHKVSPIIPIEGFEFVNEIVANPTVFFAPYEELSASLVDKRGFYLGANDKNKRTHAMVRVNSSNTGFRR